MRPWRGLGMTVTAQDEKYMREALTLAREGTALASPGPRVGAVIVSAKGELAGRGFYTYNEIEHAEALALKQAGNAARRGALYLNPEPLRLNPHTPPRPDPPPAHRQ